MNPLRIGTQGCSRPGKAQFNGDPQSSLGPRAARISSEILELIPAAELLLRIKPTALAEDIGGSSRYIAVDIRGLGVLTRQIPDSGGRSPDHLARRPILPQEAFVARDLPYRFRLTRLTRLTRVGGRTNCLRPCGRHAKEAQNDCRTEPKVGTHGDSFFLSE